MDPRAQTLPRADKERVAMTPDTDTEHWKRFGKWLRAKRIERSQELGVPRAELAAICGVHDNSWANWERGGRNFAGAWVVYRPRPENLHGIAKALDVPPAEVFKRAGVHMDDDVLVDLGPDGETKLDQLLEMVKLLVDRLPPSDEQAMVREKLRQLDGEKRARRRT
jgi:transcriptional regulator with XRE-family HTH domain